MLNEKHRFYGKTKIIDLEELKDVFNCPIVPQKGSDAFEFMYEMGLIEDEQFSTMKSAIGLRNAMIHDYMNLMMIF
jgi:uncharacterized protein YutE (UPF0331/DUF86 family)